MPSGVVVEERLRQADDRVGERRRVGGRLVAAGRDLGDDQRLDASTRRADGRRRRSRSAAASRCPGSCSSSVRSAESGRQAAVDLVEHLEQARARRGVRTARRLRAISCSSCVAITSPRSAVAGAEPAVDRRPAQSQPAGDDGQVDPLAVEVLLGDRLQHLGSARRSRAVRVSLLPCPSSRALVFETSEVERIEMAAGRWSVVLRHATPPEEGEMGTVAESVARRCGDGSHARARRRRLRLVELARSSVPGVTVDKHHVRHPPAVDRSGRARVQRDRARLAGVSSTTSTRTAASTDARST